MDSATVGEQLDHYHLDTLVARSGMASIFRATDLRTGRTVALKVPHAEVESDPVFYERFQREEEIGTTLDHPGVMKVVPDSGKTRMYMVMEWVEGRLLREIIRQEAPLPEVRAVRIARSICDALDYIHAHGVVHRDLKPENVMVDAEDHIKLIDFGIASNAGARRITFARLTNALGTPDYISPEQVKGGRGDARTDLYALGVMLYEMATGKTPFRGATPFAVMNDRVLNRPVPPREANPEVSEQLQEVIYRALERDPRKRYASAREFAWDLDHLDAVGVTAREELRDWKRRRHPVVRQAILYGLLALIPILVFALLLLVAKK